MMSTSDQSLDISFLYIIINVDFILPCFGRCDTADSVWTTKDQKSDDRVCSDNKDFERRGNREPLDCIIAAKFKRRRHFFHRVSTTLGLLSISLIINFSLE